MLVSLYPSTSKWEFTHTIAMMSVWFGGVSCRLFCIIFTLVFLHVPEYKVILFYLIYCQLFYFISEKALPSIRFTECHNRKRMSSPSIVVKDFIYTKHHTFLVFHIYHGQIYIWILDSLPFFLIDL